MSRLVVDASVAVKWFLPEPHDQAALRLWNEPHEIHAPDLLYPEVGNALWKRVQRGEMAGEQAATTLTALTDLPLDIHPARPLIPLAFEIAWRARRSVYDSLYLALAVFIDCPVVTADRAFHDAIRRGPLAEYVSWVEDVA